MIRLALIALLTFATLPLAAQNVTDPILEEQRRRALEDRTNALGNMKPRGAAPDPGPAQERLGPCFQINTLTVEGVTLLTPAQLGAIVSKYVPNCMQGADIQAVMRELDATYADRGYITAKTYIPAQNLQSGGLILTMVEGTVEDVLLIDDTKQIETKRGARQIATAFPGQKGRLFQLRDFEQGLDQMNRLASVNAMLKLQPGEEVGGSYVIVQRLQNDRFRGYARLDNQGSDGTGKNKLSLDLEIDDLLGMNDAFSFALGSTQNTNTASLSGSIPLGYWTFAFDHAYSEYLTPLNATTELFGNSRTSGFRATVVAFRDQTRTTEYRFGVQNRRADRYINGLRLTPQNLGTLSFGLTHMRLSEQARNSFDMTVTVGTRRFGASRDAPGLASNVPHAQFTKLEAGWQFQGALGTLGTLVTDLRTQYARHTLYSAEQLSLGSLSTVRGYDTTVASGDTGFYIRNDLYLNKDVWNFLPDAAAAAMAQKSQLHAFVDGGIVLDKARKTRERALGMGLGLSYYHKRFTASGAVSVPLIVDGKNKLGAPVLQVRLDLKAW